MMSTSSTKNRNESRIYTGFLRSSWVRDSPLNLVLLLLAALTYVPFVVIIVNSLKDNPQFFQEFWLPVRPFHFENYSRAWEPISKSLYYSAVYTLPTLFLVMSISALTGYAFARYRFAGRNVFFMAILVVTMLPGILLVIPMFSLIVGFGWTDTTQAIVLPWTSVLIPMGMYIMRVFFETLPREYFEAARLDGASELQLFYRIALPLAWPALSTVAVVTLIFAWNDIIWPLVVIYEASRQPIAVGVLNFNTAFNIDYGASFAGYVLASLPLLIIFTFTSRRFMQGLRGAF